MKRITLFLIIFYIFSLPGCATSKKIEFTKPKTPKIKITQPGIYHTIKKKETLWRISKIYSVDIEQLAKFNAISNTCKIDAGEKIFIPDSLRKRKKLNNDIDKMVNFDWPYKGSVAFCFNQTKKNIKNQGIDIITKSGAAINAAEDGNVVYTSNNMRGFGKTIIIQHRDNFSTVYANNKEIIVKTGDYVKRGQKIAFSGNSGRSSRSTLHFQLRKNNRAKNPLHYLP